MSLGAVAAKSCFGLAILPVLMGGFEQHISLPSSISTVEQERYVAASPDAVWTRLLFSAAIKPEEMDSAWMYQIGVPLPLSATSEESDGRLVRHITMGKNIHFDQVATKWEPAHRVLWSYLFSADSFPPQALDDHVRIGGPYFDVIDTEYLIEPRAKGSLLHVTMHYRVSTAYNWYVRPIARFFVNDFEKTALKFYAHRAEQSFNAERHSETRAASQAHLPDVIAIAP